MEEKKEKMSIVDRIKEWLLIIGVIVVVAGSSFAAYNFGLNKKNSNNNNTENKSEEKKEESEANNIEENQEEKTAEEICNNNIDLIYSQLVQNRKDSWMSTYDKEFMEELYNDNPLKSKNEIDCKSARYSNENNSSIEINIVKSEDEMPNVAVFNYKEKTSVEYEKDIDNHLPIEIYAAKFKSHKILKDTLNSEFPNGFVILVSDENENHIDAEHFIVIARDWYSLLGECNEDICQKYEINLIDNTFIKTK